MQRGGGWGWVMGGSRNGPYGRKQAVTYNKRPVHPTRRYESGMGG